MAKDCDYNKSEGIVRFRNVSVKLPYDFNQSDYMTVELRKFFSRNPQLLMHMIADNMNIKLPDVSVIHGETCHISFSIAGFGVPFFRNLACVFLIQYRIKDGLLRKSRRELRIMALLYQIQFGRTNGSKKNHLAHPLRFLIKIVNKIVKRIATFVKIAILFWKRYRVLIEFPGGGAASCSGGCILI